MPAVRGKHAAACIPEPPGFRGESLEAPPCLRPVSGPVYPSVRGTWLQGVPCRVPCLPDEATQAAPGAGHTCTDTQPDGRRQERAPSVAVPVGLHGRVARVGDSCGNSCLRVLPRHPGQSRRPSGPASRSLAASLFCARFPRTGRLRTSSLFPVPQTRWPRRRSQRERRRREIAVARPGAGAAPGGVAGVPGQRHPLGGVGACPVMLTPASSFPRAGPLPPFVAGGAGAHRHSSASFVLAGASRPFHQIATNCVRDRPSLWVTADCSFRCRYGCGWMCYSLSWRWGPIR